MAQYNQQDFVKVPGNGNVLVNPSSEKAASPGGDKIFYSNRTALFFKAGGTGPVTIKIEGEEGADGSSFEISQTLATGEEGIIGALASPFQVGGFINISYEGVEADVQALTFKIVELEGAS